MKTIKLERNVRQNSEFSAKYSNEGDDYLIKYEFGPQMPLDDAHNFCQQKNKELAKTEKTLERDIFHNTMLGNKHLTFIYRDDYKHHFFTNIFGSGAYRPYNIGTL